MDTEIEEWLIKVMLAGCSLDAVERFCHLSEMFRELLPLFTTKATSLKGKGQLYATYVRRMMLYGSETWPVKFEDSQRLHRN